MFMMDWIKALASLVFAAVAFVILNKFQPAVDWGSPAQAVLYRVAMTYLLKLDFRKGHVKFWRPQVLALLENPVEDIGLTEFAADCKKRGCLVVGHVMIGDVATLAPAKRDLLVEATRVLRDERKIEGLVEVSIATNLESGALALVQLSGLGSVKSNTVVTGLPVRANFSEPESCTHVLDWWKTVQNTVSLGLNCIVAAGFKNYNKRDAVAAFQARLGHDTKPTIDVWLSGVGEYAEMYELCAAQTMIVLQLAYLYTLNRFWIKYATLRVILVLPGQTEEEAKEFGDGFRELMDNVRLAAPLKIVCTAEAAAIMKDMKIKPKHMKIQQPKPGSPRQQPARLIVEEVKSPDHIIPAPPSPTRVHEIEMTQMRQESEENDEPVDFGDGSKKTLLSQNGNGDSSHTKKKTNGDPIHPLPVDSEIAAYSAESNDDDDGTYDPIYSDFDKLSLGDRNRVLNVLMKRHSSDAAVIFIQPAVSALSYKEGIQGARSFILHQRILSAGLCPVAIVMPNDSQVDSRVGGDPSTST